MKTVGNVAVTVLSKYPNKTVLANKQLLGMRIMFWFCLIHKMHFKFHAYMIMYSQTWC